MGLEICDCVNPTLGNVGRPDCDALKDVLYGMIYMFTFDSDGNRNKITVATDTLDDAFIAAKVNHVDPTKRWYFTGELEEIGGERAETKFAEAASGNKYRLKQGVKNRTAEIWDQGPSLLQEWEKAQCPQVSFFDIDVQRNLTGMILAVEDGCLYPIRAQKRSVDFILQDATEDAVIKLMMSLNYDQRELDGLQRTIKAVSIPADLTNVNSLFGIESVNIHTLNTEITVTLTEKYGDYANKNPNSGLLVGDFFDVVGGTPSSLFNVSTSTIIPITGFSETSDGVYVLTIAAQVTGNIIRIRPVKTGFEYSLVVANTVTSL